MEIFIPVKCVDNELLILISHGSGGIGSAEKSTAEYFLQNGFKIGLVDYFSKWNIDSLYWHQDEGFKDSYTVSFDEMFSMNFPQEKIIHVGFSLGGFFGIVNAPKFIKNYCFYPGILGFTKHLISQNYSNTTVYIADMDNWCDNFVYFKNCCIHPPSIITLKNSYHGFMIPGKDREFEIAKYHLPDKVISDDEYKKLKPNHDYLKNMYGFENKKIRLKFNRKLYIMCLKQILKGINEYSNTITRTQP